MSDGSDDEGAVEWPTGTPRYRLQLPATEEESVALDVLAAVLDAADRSAESITVRIAAGRRHDSERTRSALADLAAHPGVTVADHETSGTVPLTGDTFEALADLSDESHRLLVVDGNGLAVLDRRDDRFTVALSEAAVETLRSGLSPAVAERLDRVER